MPAPIVPLSNVLEGIGIIAKYVGNYVGYLREGVPPEQQGPAAPPHSTEATSSKGTSQEPSKP